ncbi:MAG: NADH-quinone oxidoreductase subunit G [Alphaproteobacteria bacterium]|nr:MAG: NADH-quinone oxidoreductase subunit G [Alphaproteobacteria bacterium]
MPKITIDGKEIEVPAGRTVFQACRDAGVEVPHFCFHERLAIAGNCRMCLVEMEKAPKPIASCAMPVADGMVIKTSTPQVIKARQGVMEFLLLNHPLDCPICDQGGECDLQDQAMAYGYDRGRTQEMRRAVKDKYMGPLVATEMTRCIHCTRCIRFVDEVAGVPELGGIGRGEGMEVTTYVEKALTSEMSGNIIDLCPVGALTSKPYAFTARPWELKKTESIDVLDGCGSAIRVDARGAEVMRIMPRLNESINEEWLADKPRFAYDGLKRQRLDRPYVRKGGKLQPVSWQEALSVVAQKLKSTSPDKIGAIAGDLVDVESTYALKKLLSSLGVTSMDCRQDGAKIDPSQRAGYIFNTTIAGIEQADACLIVGADLRKEAPLVMSRIRKRYLQTGMPVSLIGPRVDLTVKFEHISQDANIIEQIAAGRHPYAEKLKSAKKPMIIVGMGALQRADGAAILAECRKLAESCNMIQPDWNGFNVLHLTGGRVGALDVGFVPQKGGFDVAGMLNGKLEVVYLLNADEIDTKKLGQAFVIYQGHHGDVGASRADVILPGAAYTEKDAIYVNTEGRPQQAFAAILPPGEAKDDWKIVRALSEHVGKTLPFNTLDELRLQLGKDHPIFVTIGDVTRASWGNFGMAGTIANTPFILPMPNYYMTDVISRNSVTMAKCAEEFVQQKKVAA